MMCFCEASTGQSSTYAGVVTSHGRHLQQFQTVGVRVCIYKQMYVGMSYIYIYMYICVKFLLLAAFHFPIAVVICD